ncbi:vacuolar protein-sorting-associated protein 37 homolog 1-like [Glycine soja]|uniref:vacuolar protein-sorting-associated protein 37 homolog 1 n=1 Tax=Glycine max TaxID=3847 RepID=UPI000233BB44|nr:vacuolar protein-sorting-associated protein 37 homolog 1 [Glycine max]XP_028199346.1 vacuolar protein-sorting-associated protein 37 homolog 1-like [Glycine soja]|eukprot:XP_003545425.1 vacuolar protein-sorting-associated protein 37 homolog 1 [Glycine max]
MFLSWKRRSKVPFDVVAYGSNDVVGQPFNGGRCRCNDVNDDLCKENLQLADENLQKEPCIVELRNQNKIICTTELAMAQQKLNGLEKQKEEMMKLNSPQYLLQWIQEAMNKTEVEYENLHQQVLQRDIDIGAFLQKYKQLRTAYHRKSLVHLAARTSNI